jgi:hypothetical protein
VALIKKRLGIDVVRRAGGLGEFTVLADGVKIAERGGNWFTRGFGAGMPDFDDVVAQLETRLKA